MKCQICNRETNNFQKNKNTGEYESICNRCQNAIRELTRQYADLDEDVIEVMDNTDDFLSMLKEIDDNGKL